MEKFKRCKVCGEKKSLQSFPKHQFPRIGHRDKCKSCCGSECKEKQDPSDRWVSHTFKQLKLTGADY